MLTGVFLAPADTSGYEIMTIRWQEEKVLAFFVSHSLTSESGCPFTENTVCWAHLSVL